MLAMNILIFGSYSLRIRAERSEMQSSFSEILFFIWQVHTFYLHKLIIEGHASGYLILSMEYLQGTFGAVQENAFLIALL